MLQRHWSSRGTGHPYRGPRMCVQIAISKFAFQAAIGSPDATCATMAGGTGWPGVHNSTGPSPTEKAAHQMSVSGCAA